MGKCNHCGKDINLKDGEKNCPNCGESPYYCWNCKADITGETKECQICGFFVCPNCNECGKDCKMQFYINEIKGLCSSVTNARKIIDIFFNNKKGFIRRSCPKNVSISYAKAKLRNMALKLNGFHIRSENDRIIFSNRVDEINEKEIGTEWIVSDEREEGFYGTESREASNMGVCMGTVEKQRRYNEKTKQYYDLYIRVNKKPCEYVNWDKLIVKYCPKCKTTFPIEQITCSNVNCCYTKKTKDHEKGDARELVERKSNVNWCQLDRNEFKPVEEKNNG